MCSAQPSDDGDVWGDASDSGDERGELSREWESRRQQFYNVSAIGACAPCMHRVPSPILSRRRRLAQAGYLEGLEEGKEVTLQQGFNTGVPLVGSG